MNDEIENWLGRIHQGDCVSGMETLPDDCIDLVFADPPFNIGFEYDEYDDQLQRGQYLAWSERWMRQVFRALKPGGTFWLAIGDEYAAELKMTAQAIGWSCRSWCIWYYTFGVHCVRKFTRSHAHLFHFVNDPNRFTFNATEVKVPSARQLVYKDPRAAPGGRMPDDTWILRPQDCVDGFTADEDTWYFPRVAGTFKERAGFHGCQMPEQLLGRIIRATSNPGDIVLDPFAGSATTLAVAKKLGRRFVGFELSQQYAEGGTARVQSVCVGDSLDGAGDPKTSVLSTAAAQQGKTKRAVDDQEFAVPEPTVFSATEEAGDLLAAFAAAGQGYSVDRIVADPVLNEDFQIACDRRSVPGTPFERNRLLFRLRKSGRVARLGIETSKPTKLDWDRFDQFGFASEIAWERISQDYDGYSLDQILCDPRIAVQFDQVAQQFAPGFRPLEYRWAAIKLRKFGKMARQRAITIHAAKLGVKEFGDGQPLAAIDLRQIPEGPGVYGIRRLPDRFLYVGETDDLRTRLRTHFAEPDFTTTWMCSNHELEVFFQPMRIVPDERLARQSWLLKWHRPEWNKLDALSI